MFCFALNTLVYSQSKLDSIQDSKDFIEEKVKSSAALPGYVNHVFFQNILRIDADTLANRRLSDDEFKYLFIYGYDYYFDEYKTKWGWSNAWAFDIRGITKVSTTRVAVGEYYYYQISIYLSGLYFANQHAKHSGPSTTNKYVSKVDITIGDDAQLAIQIKKAIIRLSGLYGIKVRDGDQF
jgi:hypothetical protein